MDHPARRQTLVDTLIAVGLGTLAMLVTAQFLDASAPDDTVVDWYALTLVGVAFASLTVRRRWPMVTLGGATAATTAYLLAAYPYGPIFLAFFIAVYTVATAFPLGKAAIAVGIAFVAVLTHIWVHPSAVGGAFGIVPASAWAVVPFAIGTVVRMTREANDAARAEAIRQHLYDERMRIAQEVHDIVGHGLAAIQLQADVALHVDEQQSPKTRAALESISRASADAFEELRYTLDSIREPGGDTAPPGSGLDDIEGLCDRMRASGVKVDLHVRGERRGVDPAIGLTVYRVLQECLTNVMRHGDASMATVDIDIGDEALEMRIANPAPTPAEVTSGQGIAGMRRRVTSHGGTFSAGPSGDGFEVEVRLPVEETG